MKEKRIKWILERGTLINDNKYYRYTKIKEYCFFIEAVGKIFMMLSGENHGFIPSLVTHRDTEDTYVYKVNGSKTDIFKITKG